MWMAVTLRPQAAAAAFILEIILLIFAAGVLVVLGLNAIRPGWPRDLSETAVFWGKALRGFWERRRRKSRSFEEALDEAGFAYDRQQDIFYSVKDSWQRKYGYCRLYDEAAAPMGMILDSQPIFFEYGGKKWLIQWWKGQYDLTTGCEIGVFVSGEPEIQVPRVFSGYFYHSVDDADMLQMELALIRNGRVLFTRKDIHWWLTGFVLGEFSQPGELTMDFSITLKDDAMCRAFVDGLRRAGYREQNFSVYRNTVALRFDRPFGEQPFTRNPVTDRLIQEKNRLMCEQYQAITGQAETMEEKWRLVSRAEPAMLPELLHFGHAGNYEKTYRKLRRHLPSDVR